MRSYYDMTMIPSLRWNLAGSLFRFYALMVFLQYQFLFFSYWKRQKQFGIISLVLMFTCGIIGNGLAA